MDIGSEAQSAIVTAHNNYGGPVFLDDGRCSGWFTVPSRAQGPNMWNTQGPQGSARASSGSLCAIANQINGSNYSEIDVVLTNGGWSLGVRARNPFIVKAPAVQLPYRFRIFGAFQKALTARGPAITAFAPLAGSPPLLSNQYRTR